MREIYKPEIISVNQLKKKIHSEIARNNEEVK